MANKSLIVAGGMPVDQPAMIGPGTLYHEGDHPGADKHMALPPEDPLRTAKGDLGLSVIPHFEPRHSAESPAMPFANLKKG